MRAFKYAASIVGLSSIIGCTIGKHNHQFCGEDCLSLNRPQACGPTQIRPSEVCSVPCITEGVPEMYSPLSIDENVLTSANFQMLSLEDCVKMALSSSTIMRDLGGTVLRAPNAAISRAEPALAYTNPLIGEEAALSAFDANFFASNIFEHNDRGLNNQFFGTAGQFRQDLNTTQVGVSKRSATGGLMSVRNVTIYDRNNQLSNRFPFDSSETYAEAELRHPLLQGAGTKFNRIAGPGATPGQLNGILLARVRTDISLIEFEQSVRDLVAEVENAYWDLYYAYRDLEAKVDVRDIAEETLRLQDPNSTPQGKIAQAEEQLYRFQADIVDSLNGRPLDATRTNNGSTAGTFRGFGGLRFSERRLRLIVGMPINDGTIIRPIDAPFAGAVNYDWADCQSDALSRRTELRRQKWVIKQSELELQANRNFLKPQLDVISRYRQRGFGENLTGQDSATASLWDNQYQEWQLGLEYNLPVGLRRAHAAIQNSRLRLAREAEILKEQERYVLFGLSNAVAESKRSYDCLGLQKKRLDAIVVQLNAIQAKGDQGEKAELDVRLETHRRLLDARLRYHQCEVEYALSLRNVNLEKGTLLQYCNVALTEAMAERDAYIDANERMQRFDNSKSPAVRDNIIATSARN